jgi:predicted glycosyltransferase
VATLAGLQVWIDIENPPQVRYLLPCKARFEQAGADVVVTARDDGATYRLLENEHVDFEAVGRQPGRSRRRKVVGLVRRARALAAYVGDRRADLVVSASRPASLAARYLRLPAFFIGDYEFTNVTVQRATRTYLLFPDVIDHETFLSRGMRPDRLIPFRGIKEDLSFSGIALDEYPPHRFPSVPDDVPRLLFRPPAEESHYNREASTTFAAEVLGYLARQESVQVVYAPRYEFQTLALRRHEWVRPPLVLREPVHFVSLLKGVDLVVSSGGTMLREAAYLGVPAYSIFQSRTGAVDRYLESIGRLQFIASSTDFSSIELRVGRRQAVLNSNPRLADDILAEITSRVPHARGTREARR